jgi:serine/threonine protein kinase
VARDLGDRDVAIKVSQSVDGQELGSILVNEGRILAGCNTRRSCIFDIGRLDEGGSYWCSSISTAALHDSLRDVPNQIPRRPSFLRNRHALIRPRRGYLHRNIKPRAVRRTAADGRGSSFEVALQRAGLKSSIEIAGTPHYMAPEQLRKDAKLLGPHTDVWGFGVTLYEVLTGERPFMGTGFQELFQVIPSVAPEAPVAKDPTIPAELNRICLKCLRKDPGELRARGAARGQPATLADLQPPLRATRVREPLDQRPQTRSAVIGHLRRHGIRT